MHINNPQSKEQDDNIQVLKEVPLKFSSRLYFPMTGQSSGNIENIHVRLLRNFRFHALVKFVVSVLFFQNAVNFKCANNNSTLGSDLCKCFVAFGTNARLK